MKTQLYLDKFVALFRDELHENLSGIYLHGSLAMGCFNPNRSDIDFLVVVQDKLTADNNRRIAKMVLALHEEMPNERGLEFSIILEIHLKPFVYPTPFEFHYSDFHRERYQADENYVCGGFEDKDLAAQLVVAYERGTALYGRPLKEVYEPVGRPYYLASILHDVENASRDIIGNPMYLVLNLCRVMLYLKEEKVASKQEGGTWGVKALPDSYTDLVQQSLDEYTGTVDKQEYDNQRLLDFADYMLRQIKQAI